MREKKITNMTLDDLEKIRRQKKQNAVENEKDFLSYLFF